MKTEIISQYRSALQMLTDTIEKCPDELWDSDAYANKSWRIAYHTVFYTALYLSKDENSFTLWEKHLPNYNYLGSTTFDHKPIVVNLTYSKADVLNYARSVFNTLEDFIQNTGFDQPSGFSWIPMNKLELHFYNIRHIQHHTGQLVERLRQAGITGIRWR